MVKIIMINMHNPYILFISPYTILVSTLNIIAFTYSPKIAMLMGEKKERTENYIVHPDALA